MEDYHKNAEDQAMIESEESHSENMILMDENEPSENHDKDALLPLFDSFLAGDMRLRLQKKNIQYLLIQLFERR